MMWARLVLLVIAAQIFSCANPSLVKIRPELIRSYRLTDQEKEFYQAPYVALYSKGQKQLAYVAADHGSDLENPTFKTILHTFETFRPEAVIIEGVEFRGGYSPKSYSDIAKQCAEREFKDCSESAYTAYLADKNAIPFIPGEVPEAEIAKQFLAAGYPDGEYKQLLAGQLISQYKRQQKYKLAKIDHYLKHEAGVSYKSFKRWYWSKSQKHFSMDLVDSETFSPRVDASPTYFNNLAALESSVREAFIFKRLQEGLYRFNRVMIVFGASHLVKEREALLDAFGQSKDLKFYP